MPKKLSKKKTAKKVKRITLKKKTKKAAVKVKTKKTLLKVKPEKPIGKVTHYYGHLKVAIVKFKETIKLGTKIKIIGATTKFSQKISSMQFDHKPVKIAKKNIQIGIKVSKKTREGDQVFLDK